MEPENADFEQEAPSSGTIETSSNLVSIVAMLRKQIEVQHTQNMRVIQLLLIGLDELARKYEGTEDE